MKNVQKWVADRKLEEEFRWNPLLVLEKYNAPASIIEEFKADWGKKMSAYRQRLDAMHSDGTIKSQLVRALVGLPPLSGLKR
jgi:hypothetical protein